MKTKRVLLILLAVAMVIPFALTGCSGAKRGGQIIVGSTTELSGDWGEAMWTNNAADKDIRDLMNGYSPIAMNKDAEYVTDKNVVKSVEGVVNEDGTKTFTITLQEDLKWNDGSGITAKDYVAKLLIFSNPAILALDGSGSAGQLLVGWDEYKAGTSKIFTGVRLLGDYQYSITVKSDYIPYYYDAAYAGMTPIPVQMWLPADITISDDGTGCYFSDNYTADYVNPVIEAARYKSEGRISCGPYKIESFDKTSLQCTLVINDYYKGNFENQKPNVEKIIYVKANQETMMDAIKTGSIDILSGLTDGSEIKTALEYEEEGGFATCKYERNGYGKLMFQCDFGPTQFREVRYAIAYCLDRESFAQTFCSGFGAVVNGPYGFAMWMYKDSEDELNKNLNTYTVSLDSAVKCLEDSGWTLDKDGNAYTSGVRYKKVTAEEAGDYKHNVTLADGTILMPLIIEWASSEGNSVSELLKVMLAEGEITAKAGIQINQNVMTFSELLNYMYRDASQGDQYGVKTYGMYNLATNYTAEYDVSYSYTLDPDYVAAGYNTNFIFDTDLDKLSMDMVYGVEPGDSKAYLAKWVAFVERWNYLLPEIPLYSNIYYDLYNAKLKNYEVNALWDWTSAILYSYVSE